MITNYNNYIKENVFFPYSEMIFHEFNKTIENKDYKIHFTLSDNSRIGNDYFDFLDVEYKYNDKFITFKSNYLNSDKFILFDIIKNNKELVIDIFLKSYIIVFFDNDFDYRFLYKDNISLDTSLDDIMIYLFKKNKEKFISLLTKENYKIPIKYFEKYKYLINANKFDLI